MKAILLGLVLLGLICLASGVTIYGNADQEYGSSPGGTGCATRASYTTSPNIHGAFVGGIPITSIGSSVSSAQLFIQGTSCTAGVSVSIATTSGSFSNLGPNGGTGNQCSIFGSATALTTTTPGANCLIGPLDVTSQLNAAISSGNPQFVIRVTGADSFTFNGNTAGTSGYYIVYQPSTPSGCNCYIATDQCCNDLNNNGGRPTCYNPALYQCNDGNRLCAKGFLSCGAACYNPAQYACSNGQLVPASTPPNATCPNPTCSPLLCCSTDTSGYPCYNPNHKDCTASGLYWRCNGISGASSSVCSGHGSCVGLDVCQCTGGYTGYNCQTPPSGPVCNSTICNNLACCQTPTAVLCYNPNHQFCTGTGLVWTCLGTPATSPSVCLGHGDCTALNTCTCRDGYTGATCETPPAPSGCNCYIATDKCCNDLNNNGGRPTCYNPALYQCNDGNRLCAKGFLSCGAACYPPDHYKCVNGNLQPV